jgi:integrase
MLADLIRQTDRAAAGVPTGKAPVWTVAACLADWEASLVAKGAGAKHRRITTSNARRALAGAELVSEITASLLEHYLAGLAKDGYGVQTRNLHLSSAKAFCNWLVREGRLPRNPLASLRKANADADRRHYRRALSDEEFGRLLDAAAKSQTLVHGLAGTDRRVLYTLAAATGFRVRELAGLCPSSFLLDDAAPAVVCTASYAKNGKRATQPLPSCVVPLLRAYLADRPADEPVWPGYWQQRASELLQEDLAAAGVPYETRDGFADFHSLRTLYVTGLFRVGTHPRIAQGLARHSTINLTMGTYTRVADDELARAVQRLVLPLVPPSPQSQNGRAEKRAG